MNGPGAEKQRNLIAKTKQLRERSFVLRVVALHTAAHSFVLQRDARLKRAVKP